MPQQSKGKHTIRLGSQESDSTLDHKPLRYTNRHFKHHRTESQRSVPSLVPWLLMLNPNHTNEETCNQSTKETPEERTNKEPAAWAVRLYPNERQQGGYSMHRHRPTSIHRSEHQAPKRRQKRTRRSEPANPPPALEVAAMHGSNSVPAPPFR
jgi:hypothetical protein